MISRIRLNFKVATYGLALLLLSTNWTTDFSGGDIAAARKSYLSEYPIDIWGGFSGIFYSSIPELLIGWGRYLLILQLTLSVFSVNSIYSQISDKLNKSQKGLYLILSASALFFATYLTRDSTSFAFILFAIAILSRSTKKFKKTNIVIGFFSLVVGFSFRPWLSIVGVIILFLTLKKFMRKSVYMAITIIFVVAPLIVDQSAYLANDKLVKVHPELQVIIMDASSFACLGLDEQTRKSGEEVLNQFEKGETKSSTSLCKNFRMNTWQSAGFWKLTKAEKASLDIAPSPISEYKVQASTSLSDSRIEAIRNAWLKMIQNNPKEYVELKMLQATQLMLGADSAELNLSKSNNLISDLRKLINLPFNILLATHGLSIIACLVILLLVGLKSTHLETRLEFIKFIGIVSIPLCWLGISAIAFIGDNGRYTYSATFIAFYLLALWSVQDKGKVK
ncbi:hypothetical protein MCEMRE254_00023 [Candidatus Nanopelagicaceae bacterium]